MLVSLSVPRAPTEDEKGLREKKSKQRRGGGVWTSALFQATRPDSAADLHFSASSEYISPLSTARALFFVLPKLANFNLRWNFFRAFFILRGKLVYDRGFKRQLFD